MGSRQRGPFAAPRPLGTKQAPPVLLQAALALGLAGQMGARHGGTPSPASRRAGATKGVAPEVSPCNRGGGAPRGSRLDACRLRAVAVGLAAGLRSPGCGRGRGRPGGPRSREPGGQRAPGAPRGGSKREPGAPQRSGDEAAKQKARGATPPQAAPRLPSGPG